MTRTLPGKQGEMPSRQTEGRTEVHTLTLLQDLLGGGVVVSEGVARVAVLRGKMARSDTKKGQQPQGRSAQLSQRGTRQLG